MMTPKSPYLVWTHIGRQLKIWNHNGINDTHVTKMMKLWLGYEFVDLMDEKGKIPRSYFNEARKRLGYKTWGLMLNDVRRTQSFYMVNTGGKESEEADYIFSPIWHTYEESDGRLLSGSIPLSKSQKESQKESLVATDYVDNINNIDNPNGVNAAALSLLKGDWPDGNQKKMFSVKKEVVKEYFDWLLEQTEGNHQQLVNDIKYKIAHPLDKDGNPVKPLNLSEEEIGKVLRIMIDEVFVPYFVKRSEFFRRPYLIDKQKRVWWLKNLFGKGGNKFINRALAIYKGQRKTSEADEFMRMYRLRKELENS